MLPLLEAEVDLSSNMMGMDLVDALYSIAVSSFPSCRNSITSGMVTESPESGSKAEAWLFVIKNNINVRYDKTPTSRWSGMEDDMVV